MKKVFLFVVMFIFSGVSHGLTFREREFICPIGGEKFSMQMAASGTSFGTGLDLKPYGAIVAPWPLAKCPKNGLVLFKQFSKADVAVLAPFIDTQEYQKLQKTQTHYYVAAQLAKRIGLSRQEVSSLLLQATWEAETSEQYAKYAMEASIVYNEILGELSPGQEQWLRTQLLLGEFERRMGLFDAAEKRFLELQNKARKNSFFSKIISYQLGLIAKHDAQPQAIPSMEE
jgi:hypothetical protein